MNKNKKNIVLGLAIMCLVLALDQISKGWVLSDVIAPPDHNQIELTSFFNLVLVWNYGISFGIFASQHQPFLLITMSVVILIILLLWLIKNTSQPTAYALGSIMGGAIGNVVDRLRFGAVVDFLDFHLGNYHWPAFNIADSCIFIGVVVLCGSAMFIPERNHL